VKKVLFFFFRKLQHHVAARACVTVLFPVNCALFNACLLLLLVVVVIFYPG